MNVNALAIQDLTTVAGVALVVNIFLYAGGKVLNWTEKQKDRFGPISALGLGLIIALAGVAALGATGRQDIFQAALTGLLGGSTAMGFYSIAQSATGH